MSVSMHAAILGLKRTTDVGLLCYLAEDLGERVRGAPRIAVPGDWAIVRQKSGVKAAAFAARWCGDSEATYAILRTTSRVTVREAVAENPFLTHADRVRMAAWASEEGYGELAHSLTRRRGRTAHDYFLEMVNDGSYLERWKELEHLLWEIGHEEADRNYALLVTRGLNAKSGIVAGRILRGAFLGAMHIDMTRGLHAAWAGMKDRPSVSTLYGMLSDEQKTVLCEETVAAAVSEVVVKPMGVLVTKELMKRTRGAEILSSSARWQHRVFSSRAIDLLVEDADWIDVLSTQYLSDQQFFRAVTVAKSKARGLIHVMETREQAEALIGALEGSLSSVFSPLSSTELSKFLHTATGVDDPMLERLFFWCDSVARASYLTGGWSVRGEYVAPRAALLQYEIEHLDYSVLDMEKVHNAHFSHLSVEYYHHVIDCLPGAVKQGMHYDDVADYIWERLCTTSENPLLALDILSENLDRTLDDICSMAQLVTHV